MIANLAEMKDGEYVITIDGKAQNLEDLMSRTDSTAELEKNLEAAKPKTMEELAEEQLSLNKVWRRALLNFRKNLKGFSNNKYC